MRLGRACATERAPLLRTLYLRFSVFVADDLAHMAEEEQLFLPILQSLFSDAELMDIEDRIMSRVSQDELAAYGRIMLPAATRTERIAMLGAIRANAPADAFVGLLQATARPSLSPDDYRHLCGGLGGAG
ncbi:MAG: hypothetical protein KAF42_15485 [Sphingopyxis terrae]|nr:hypothetical protein [Sphingopyxis terrae]